MLIRATDPLDDFLEGAGAATELGERLETIGLAFALPGIVVAVGLVAFLLFVHKSGSDESRFLLNVIGVCGLVVLIGGVVEVAGTVTILGGDWLSDLGDDRARGPGVRLLSGLVVTAALSRRDAPVDGPWAPNLSQVMGMIGVVLGALSFSVDGHTVSEGEPFLHSAMNIVHVLAAGIWVGGVFGLLVVSLRRRRRQSVESMAPIFMRFSTVATLAIVSVSAAGVGMSFLIVDSFGDYFTTAWGLLLLVKVGLVAIAAAVGAYNHYVIVPALDDDPDHPLLLPRALKTVMAEVILLLAVGLITVFLAGASPN